MVDVVVVEMIDDLLMFILDHDKYDALLALFYNFGMWNVCRFLYNFVVHVFDDHNDDDDDDFVVLVPVVIFVPLYCRSDINSPFWRAKLPHQTWDLAKQLQMKI